MKREKKLKRCAWVTEDPDYVKYHDQEWGVPIHDDRLLFEFLVLEGAQAGLSWITILKKRKISEGLLTILMLFKWQLIKKRKFSLF
ncbi:methyladenine glycosylase domain protein [Leptospira kirschneri serovar Grippotyphosa str. Moskva]|nr:methyladenine glycosylase domain protein [Leptospira kirschneri serovar Grippotyphosa str. Moskva]